MKSLIYILIFVLITVIIGGLILYNTNTINDINSEVVVIKNKPKTTNYHEWKTFISDKEFKFEVAKDWKCITDDDGRINCKSDATWAKIKDLKIRTAGFGYIPNDLTIYIHEMNVKKFLILDEPYISPKNTILGNQKAFEYTMPGYAGNFTVITEFDGGTLELSFGKNGKEKFKDAEKHVIESFKFIK